MNKMHWTHPKINLVLVAFAMLFNARSSLCQATGMQTSTLSTPRARVIVFVHGLHGSRESWRAANGAYWPDMVRNDRRFAYSDVEVAEYPTPASHGEMSSAQLSGILWTRLEQDHVWEHREVVFIAHSLGGILVEEMLLRHPLRQHMSSSSCRMGRRTRDLP